MVGIYILLALPIYVKYLYLYRIFYPGLKIIGYLCPTKNSQSMGIIKKIASTSHDNKDITPVTSTKQQAAGKAVRFKKVAPEELLKRRVGVYPYLM